MISFKLNQVSIKRKNTYIRLQILVILFRHWSKGREGEYNRGIRVVEMQVKIKIKTRDYEERKKAEDGWFKKKKHRGSNKK